MAKSFKFNREGQVLYVNCLESDCLVAIPGQDAASMKKSDRQLLKMLYIGDRLEGQCLDVTDKNGKESSAEFG